MSHTKIISFQYMRYSVIHHSETKNNIASSSSDDDDGVLEKALSVSHLIFLITKDVFRLAIL